MKPARKSAGIVVLRRFATPTTPAPHGSFRFLLLRAYKNWDFPKGRIEPGEVPLQTAIRELEETGLTSPFWGWGEDFIETAPYAGGKIARYYLAEVPHGDVYLPISAELGRPEHNEFRWVDAREARQLLSPRLLPVLDWALAKAGCPR